MDQPRSNEGSNEGEDSGGAVAGRSGRPAHAIGLRMGSALIRPLLLGFLVLATVLVASSPSASASHAKSKSKAKTCASASWIANNPQVIAFASTHSALIDLLLKDPAAANAVAANPSAANIAAAEKAFGAAGLAELARFKTQLAEYVQPYMKQVSCLEAHPNNQISGGGQTTAKSSPGSVTTTGNIWPCDLVPTNLQKHLDVYVSPTEATTTSVEGDVTSCTLSNWKVWPHGKTNSIVVNIGSGNQEVGLSGYSAIKLSNGLSGWQRTSNYGGVETAGAVICTCPASQALTYAEQLAETVVPAETKADGQPPAGNLVSSE
jgi:hypothetical protein